MNIQLLIFTVLPALGSPGGATNDSDSGENVGSNAAATRYAARRYLAMLLLIGCCILARSTYGQTQQSEDQRGATPTPHQQTHDHMVEKSSPHSALPAGAEPLPLSRPGAVTVGRAQIAIPDLRVIDQDGNRLRFYTDLMKGKVVVLSFFFTSCVDVCPMQGMALAKLQRRLGERAGKDVFFVSVSKDPVTDTPHRLKDWASKYRVGPGWRLVTGEEAMFRKLIRDFTGESLGGSNHLPVLLIGNDRTGRWIEAMTESGPDELIRLIDTLSSPGEP